MLLCESKDKMTVESSFHFDGNATGKKEQKEDSLAFAVKTKTKLQSKVFFISLNGDSQKGYLKGTA